MESMPGAGRTACSTIAQGSGDRVAEQLRCVSLEEKLGIHASPTAVLSFGDDNGAVGYLVGEENQGMRCMFTMMNAARLAVGVQGVAIAERAYQRAAETADAAIAIAEEFNFPHWRALSVVAKGEAQIALGETDAGTEAIEDALSAYASTHG